MHRSRLNTMRLFARFRSPLCGVAIALAALGYALPVLPASADPAVASATEPVSRARARMNTRVFDTVWNTVRRQYYDPGLHGVDWRAARDTYRPLAIAAPDDRLLYRAIAQMLDLLDDEHAAAIPPALARRQDAGRTTRPVMGLVMTRETVDVWRVDRVRPGSPAAEAGVQLGWHLQAVDGVPWGGTFDVEEGRPLQLRLTDDGGQVHDVTVVPRQMEPIPAFSRDDGRPGVVVLRIEAFEPGLGRWLGEQLAGLAPEVDVILDLRANPGGLLSEADATLSCFLPAGRFWATRISRSGRPVTLTIRPGCGALQGPVANDVALLVDANSRSAAELTPAALQEAGRALVVGERTAGAVLISQDTRLPDGGRLTLSRSDYVTSGGVRLEKRGVEPDILASRSVEDLRADRDPALDAAIAALARPGLGGVSSLQPAGWIRSQALPYRSSNTATVP